VVSIGFLVFFAILAPGLPSELVLEAGSLALWLSTTLHTMLAVATRRVDRAWMRVHRALYAAILTLTATNIAVSLYYASMSVPL